MTKITWLGHGTTLFEFDSGKTLLVDPWTEGNPAYPKDHHFSRIDAIAISHGHMDHIHDAIPLAEKFSPKTVAIFETAHWLESKGVKDVIGMNKGGTFDLGFVKLTMTHAVHSCGILDGDKIVYGGEAAGWIITQQDARKIYYAGDTTVFSDMALLQELYKPELAFLPIGDHFTMGPYEAAKAVQLLKAKKVVPMHFGTFPQLTGMPEKLQEYLKDGIAEIWNLTPGTTVEW